MAWGRSDFLAAGMILTIIIIGILIAANMLGVFSINNNSVFPFR